MKVLILFSITYFCEVSFSALTAMKTKYRSRMNVQDVFKCVCPKFRPELIICYARPNSTIFDNFANVYKMKIK